jgi:hypothetical protein
MALRFGATMTDQKHVSPPVEPPVGDQIKYFRDGMRALRVLVREEMDKPDHAMPHTHNPDVQKESQCEYCWRCKIERVMMRANTAMDGVECADGQASTVGDESGAGREEIQESVAAAPVVHAEGSDAERVRSLLQKEQCVVPFSPALGPDGEQLITGTMYAYAQGALMPLLTGEQIERLVPVLSAALAAAVQQERERMLDWAYTAVWQIWNKDDKNEGLAAALVAIRGGAKP